MFTLLGVVALALREWRRPPLDEHEEVDLDEEPTTRSSAGQVNDDQGATSKGTGEVPQMAVCTTSKDTDEVAPIYATSKGIDDSPPSSDGDPQTSFLSRFNIFDEIHLISDGSDSIVDDFQSSQPCSAMFWDIDEVRQTSNWSDSPADDFQSSQPCSAMFWDIDEVRRTSNWSDSPAGNFQSSQSLSAKLQDIDEVSKTSKGTYSVVEDSPQLKPGEIIDINVSQYKIDHQMGGGGFGSIFAATRVADGLKVAIKLASNEYAYLTEVDGYDKPVPLEVLLHHSASEGPRAEEIIELLDWKLEENFYFMVLERFMPCQDLMQYITHEEITEDTLRLIVYQAIVAAQLCCKRGVFHRDIKMENLLINPETLEVKLIDFGCGEFLTDAAYTEYAGTFEYAPPEFEKTGKYYGKPATVWSLGVFLYTMLFHEFPTEKEYELLDRELIAIENVSEECTDFLCWCLKSSPDERIKLEELHFHRWFDTITL